ncbi:MAG TPA: glycoside hydrolase family 99-like domain-containing protein [Burkholderiaceae bacterium]|nr:glycoside hydrolase family 99-like domain-containing protein [Burkholderiaceae bacterium]
MAGDANCRLLSVVLPQFHPIPENDQWWGKGFTEWTNVARARPLFKGHYQPHLPSELGFYDLRLPEARLQQAELAREHGIGGFCYYHYWFSGHRLLGRPVDEIVRSGTPYFPFCLCWANESWTRSWAGGEKDVLIEQRYSSEDDLAHIRSLLPVLADKRHIRIDNKPLFIIYRATNLPEPARTFDCWRTEALRAGLGELCLAQFEAAGHTTAADPRSIGLDLSIEFAPDWRRMGGQYYATPKARLAMALGILPRAYAQHRVCDYRNLVANANSKPPPPYPFLRCVTPGFDNSPRRPHNATILLNNTPENYGAWLAQMIEWTCRNHQGDHRIVFINAWNEWAEGNHLEPDTRHGRAYLEATRNAARRPSMPPPGVRS